MTVGSHIGQYRILRKIGVGGMGTVYLGEHILLGRRAAIKALLPALSVQSAIVERFFTEARATSAITDHGVVQIFDFGYHVDGTAYIVMELLEGESLQTRIDRLGRLAPSDALRIARQVAGSLAAAHERDIVHRDLKPENIYLIHDAEAQSGERTKILDFGICKLGLASADVGLTQSGTTMGTPVYMSPEQCRGAGKVDHRSDIYALGGVLFHMVAGRPPFEKEGAGELIVAHLQEAPPHPSTFVDELPDLVDGLIMRCLEKSADDRFQTMTELQHALEYVIARISTTGNVVPPLAPAMPISPGSRSVVRARGSPALAIDEDDDPRVTRLRPQSHAAVGIVLFGLVATLIAVLVMTSRVDAVADSATTRPAIAPAVVTQAATAAAATHAVNTSKDRTVKQPTRPTAKATRPRAKPPKRRPGRGSR